MRQGDGSAAVAAVWDESAAARAGVTLGDVLTRTQGQAAESIPVVEINELLNEAHPNNSVIIERTPPLSQRRSIVLTKTSFLRLFETKL